MNDETRARTALLKSSSDAATRVFTTILTHSPISRIDVARLAGLSQGAVTKAVIPLVGAGLVDDTLDSKREGLPGRPASPVAVVPEALVAIGVKVNADELIGVASDLQTRTLALAAHPTDLARSRTCHRRHRGAVRQPSRLARRTRTTPWPASESPFRAMSTPRPAPSGSQR